MVGMLCGARWPRCSAPALSKALRRLQHTLHIDGRDYACDEWTNVPPQIIDLVGRDVYKLPSHPIGILRNRIEQKLKPLNFTPYSDFRPVVTVHDNFDALGFPESHPGRLRSDTYYLNKSTLLRTHSSAHEIECFRSCPTPGYVITADVYRRDTVDRTHYPVFHQMEGARTWSTDDVNLIEKLKADLQSIPRPQNISVEDPLPPFSDTNPKQENQSTEVVELLSQNLKRTIELIVADLFGASEQVKVRWVEAYFPWTSPSWEIEVWWQGQWLEVCGCGVVKQEVFNNAGIPQSVGWAFGIGLERAAMLLFHIPDIRLFWSSNPKFLGQFKEGAISRFQPWSKFPTSTKDIAFWNDSDLHENDVMEIVRTYAPDLCESVEMIDTFQKDGRTSNCYRLTFQSMDRTLQKAEITAIQQGIVSALEERGAVVRH